MSHPSAFRVAVKDHVMIAHSLTGEVFGPAQRLHGATYEVITEYVTDDVDQDGIVVDIGLATDTLKAVLDPLRFTNLDDLPQFEGQNTTTEYLARWIHQQVCSAFAGRFVGGLRVTLEESRVAWASYEGPIG